MPVGWGWGFGIFLSSARLYCKPRTRSSELVLRGLSDTVTLLVVATRLRGSCPRQHSAPDSPVPGHQQSRSRAHAHLCKVRSVQEDVPFHISLRAGWLRKQRQVRTHGAVWPAGSPPRSLGLVPALALCCLMTFGRRKAAATDGMQHAGHPILSPWDMPLRKVA